MASVVTVQGNEGYSGSASAINLLTYDLGTTDVLFVAMKWEVSTASPVLALQGTNSAITFDVSTVWEHPTLDIFYCYAWARGFASSTGEQLILDLDYAGGGRAGWAAQVFHLRDVPGGSTPFVDDAKGTATADGGTTVCDASSAVHLGTGGGVVVACTLSYDDAGALTAKSGYTAPSDNSGSGVYFRRGQYKIFTGSATETVTSTIANNIAAVIMAVAFGAPVSGDPVIEITSAIADGLDIVVSGTHTATGTPTIEVTITPAAGSAVGPTAATIVTSSTWTIRFTDPGAQTYSAFAEITDDNGTADDTQTGIVLTAPTLAVPVITSAPNGLSPISVSGTGLPGCTIDLLVDGTTTQTNVATVNSLGAWTTSVTLSAGVHTLKARQNEVAVAGIPPTPGSVVVTERSPGNITITVADPGQPRTKFNWFRYSAQSAADDTGVLVGSSFGTTINVDGALTGWYSVGLENTVDAVTEYGHKSLVRTYYASPGSGGGGGGGGDLIPSDDPSVLQWMTPDTTFAAVVTDGSFQCDSPTNRTYSALAGYPAGVTGATHSSEGIAWPAGGTGDRGYALRRTTLGGKARLYNQIGNALPVSIGGTTYRSEILCPGTPSNRIDRGSEWIIAGLLRFTDPILPSGSFFDLHHEQYEGGNPYGGPGPAGLIGGAGGLSAYWSLGLDGAWQSSRNPMASLYDWTPQAEQDYWVAWHGKQDTRDGYESFLHFYLQINDGPVLGPFSRIGKWGVDTNHSSVTSMYWKTGMYAWGAPGTGPFGRYGVGMLLFDKGTYPLITVARALATARAIA